MARRAFFFPTPDRMDHAGPISIGSADLPHTLHACAFVSGDHDEDLALLPFARYCATCRDKCIHFTDPARHPERVNALERAGIRTAEAMASGRLEIRSWSDTYLRSGRFDADAMLAVLADTLRSARRGFGGARLWANMEWSLLGAQGSEELAAYESRANPVIEAEGGVVVCVYHAPKYPPHLVMDILRAHPYVVAGGSVVRNSLYVPPDAYLRDLERRRDEKTGRRRGGP